MQGLIEKYMKSTRCYVEEQADEKQVLESKMEVSMLKNEIDVLQKGLRYMFQGGAGKMTLDELRILENNLEVWMYHIRSAKMDIMSQEIQLLKNKEGILKAANKCLQEQMEMQYIAAETDPIMTNMPCPLTVQNEIYQY
ncbi:putative transcription factor, K-box [Helianthus annuus]|nr:putative transcription factor, K-box [Helianthus annuus]KAJ0543559.1 putative transcription factor, K-box [Helianthus annuus]KAJ0708613.1 putative transcription factor, K-box [Helianthus annuus]